jgi:protein-L-isoaspartate(D-aspartate) O-methyltransferase
MVSETVTNDSLVELLRERGLLYNPKIAAAFEHVQRHRFLPDVALEQVYTDTSVTVRVDATGESICSATQPSMLAFMLNQLDLQPGHNVLEIGTGTGYTVALMRNILGDSGTITTLEIDPDISQLAEENLTQAGVHQYNLVTVDGAEGYAPRAAYDRIIATAGIWDIPKAWLRQLKPDGRIVAPVWLDGLQVSGAFKLQADGTVICDHVMPSAFVYIRGMAAGPKVRNRVGSTAMTLIADDVAHVDSVALATLLSSDHEAAQLSRPLDTAGYWYGFLPYLMLREPEDDVFALYYILEGRTAYGIEGEGFVFLTPASACFVPYYGLGFAHSFAGADAFLAVEDYLKEWDAAGQPGINTLRLRFSPKTRSRPQIKTGKLYERRNHYLHVWMGTAN